MTATRLALLTAAIIFVASNVLNFLFPLHWEAVSLLVTELYLLLLFLIFAIEYAKEKPSRFWTAITSAVIAFQVVNVGHALDDSIVNFVYWKWDWARLVEIKIDRHEKYMFAYSIVSATLWVAAATICATRLTEGNKR